MIACQPPRSVKFEMMTQPIAPTLVAGGQGRRGGRKEAHVPLPHGDDANVPQTNSSTQLSTSVLSTFLPTRIVVSLSCFAAQCSISIISSGGGEEMNRAAVKAAAASASSSRLLRPQPASATRQNEWHDGHQDQRGEEGADADWQQRGHSRSPPRAIYCTDDGCQTTGQHARPWAAQAHPRRREIDQCQQASTRGRLGGPQGPHCCDAAVAAAAQHRSVRRGVRRPPTRPPQAQQMSMDRSVDRPSLREQRAWRSVATCVEWRETT